MNIWVTRHGQTDMNRKHLMQGRTNAPLNETGRQQAAAMHKKAFDQLHKMGAEKFDAIYASPLDRAIVTAGIIGGVDCSSVRIDDRIIEVDFGKYELHRYYLLGPAMTLYWLLPEHISAPETVEPISSMVARSRSFLQELELTGEENGWQNVLVTCHGGIMRAVCGYLDDRPDGIMWRPKPHNCEIRIFASEQGKHQYLDQIRL